MYRIRYMNPDRVKRVLIDPEMEAPVVFREEADAWSLIFQIISSPQHPTLMWLEHFELEEEACKSSTTSSSLP